MLDYLHNKIDICRVPFSDIGSRLLVFQVLGQSEIYIKLAERLTGIEPGLGTYKERPPFIQELKFLNEDGIKIDFVTISSPEILKFETSSGLFGLTFQDTETIAIGVPENKISGIQFLVNHTYKKFTPQGGEIKKIKNFAYKTKAKIIQNDVQTLPDGELITLILEAGKDDCILLRISGDDDLSLEVLPFSLSSTISRNRWAKLFGNIPVVLEKYQEKYTYAWWVLLNNIVSPRGILTRDTVMPSKAYYLGAWLWDNALHAIALRHLDRKLAIDQILLMLDHQLPDGMLPDAIYDEGVVSEIDHPIYARVTKSPILAWAAYKVYESFPDGDFLKKIYAPLVRENAWWFSQNDFDANGLVEYAHPYSSGLDDNPLWDGKMPVESPDINTYLFLQMETLSNIAKILGKNEEASMWKTRSDALLDRMISTMWDEEKGIFWATHNQKPVSVITPFNLFPLWTGKLSEDIVEKIVSNLFSPILFGGKYSVPTVARNDVTFDPERMWRGPVWANINYFLIEALQRNGKLTQARDLREKTLELIAGNPGIYEYYNPNTGIPPKTAAPVFSWTAAVFIELAIQATIDFRK